MSDEVTNDLLKPETKELYDADAKGYFRNIGSSISKGPSADDAAVRENFLPSKAEQAKNAERLGRGFDKTSRSGARVNSPNAVPAIFPNGLKEASDFISEMTPGKYKPAAPAKPQATQTKATGYFPKPEAVLDICIDCLKPVDPNSYVGGLTIIAPEDPEECIALGVSFGALVVYCICTACNDEGIKMARDVTPLALVFGGNITKEEDIKLAIKYNFPIHIHDGTEKTYGQWKMIERAEKLMQNLNDYLKEENKKPASPVFRTRGKVAQGN